MVQVLPYVPSFGEQLAPVLSKAGSDIGRGLAQRSARKALENYFQNPQQEQQAENQKAQSGQEPMSPYQEMINKSGGPSLLDVNNLYNLFENAYPGHGKIAADYALNQHKVAAEEASKMRIENQKRQSSVVEKQIEKSAEKREILRKEKRDLKSALEAVQTGDVGGFDINYFADILGPAGEPLKTAKGVQLESATKNLLLDSLQKISGRGNQWIEQQIRGAVPSIGKSKEANETLIVSAMAYNDIEEKILEAKDSLISKYEQNGITPPSNIDQIVTQMVKPYAEFIEDKLAYDLRSTYEKNNPSSIKDLRAVRKGTPLTLEKRDFLVNKFGGDKQKAKAYAEKLGYVIPSPRVLQSSPLEETELAQQ